MIGSGVHPNFPIGRGKAIMTTDKHPPHQLKPGHRPAQVQAPAGEEVDLSEVMVSFLFAALFDNQAGEQAFARFRELTADPTAQDLFQIRSIAGTSLAALLKMALTPLGANLSQLINAVQ